MPDDNDLPQATVVRRRRGRISVVWLIPILAAVVAIGIAVQRILSEGPTITIVLTLAQGVEAGKTVIKYKDVNIGQVTAVKLTPDYAKVEITAKITKSASGLMVEDAKFWVVEPRITLSGVSGLGTLLSGNYIGFEAGKSTKAQHTFVGLAEPPIITRGQGKALTLRAAKLGSLGVGAPVYYRSLEAGQVLAYDLSKDGLTIDVKIFVNAPYDRFVNSSTRFWNASGIDVSVGAGGVEVRTESLVALIAGGVAFDTPASARPVQPAAANTVFTLHPDRTAALKQPDVIARRYVLYFKETLRGLAVGAPVTLLGLTAGEVVDVGLDLDPVSAVLRGRAEIVVYPERLMRRLGPQQAREQLKDDESERLHVVQAADRGAPPACSAPERKPAHGPALRRLRLFPRHAQGQGRHEPGDAGAADGPQHHSRARGQAQQHRGQARPAAARRDRRAGDPGAGDAQRHPEGRQHHAQ